MPSPPTTVLSESAKGCLLLHSRALLAIRRAPLDRHELEQARDAIERASADAPSGLVMLTAVRLSPDFPIEPGHEASLRELAESVRAIDRRVVANATVLEFGGIRAAALRTASRTLWSLARMRGVLGHFDRLTDAIAWLAPHAIAIGAPDDAATYVRLYREADGVIAELDAKRWARGETQLAR